ncbi:MAG: hypothetical protein GXO91_08455 [FCB group bacterium]|nr:hypothetical protein [FCB group bacterium]
MLKKITLIILLLLPGCTEKSPTYYYTIENFDLLRIGSNLVDLVITPDGNTLIAADSGNNRVIFVDVSGETMIRTANILVGSTPTSLCLSDDGNTLYVGLSGSSQIAIVDVATREVTHFQLDEDGPMDVEVFGDKLITTFISDQSIYHKTKMYDLQSGELLSSKSKAGKLALDPVDGAVYVLDDSFERVNLYKFIIDGDVLSGNLQSSDIAQHPVELNDLEYVPGTGIVAALSGTDFEGHELKHAFLFDPEELNLLAQFDVKSTPLAAAATPDGTSLFFSPSKADGAGTFVIEFDNETYLQRNYYLAAGKLSTGAITVDPSGTYIFVAVDDLADNSNDEPYSGNSFDIQRIKIEPIGTYPINDF